MGTELRDDVANDGKAMETEGERMLPDDPEVAGQSRGRAVYETPMIRGFECDPYEPWWRPTPLVEMTDEEADRIKYRTYIKGPAYKSPPILDSPPEQWFDRSYMEVTSRTPYTANGKVYRLKTDGFAVPPALCSMNFAVKFSESVYTTSGVPSSEHSQAGEKCCSTSTSSPFIGHLAYGSWYAVNVLGLTANLTVGSKSQVNQLLKSFFTSDLRFMDDGAEFGFDVDGHDVKLVVDEYRAMPTSGVTELVGRLVGWPRDAKPDGLRLPLNGFTENSRTRTSSPATEISDPVDGTVAFVCPGWPVELAEPGTAVLAVGGEEIRSTPGRVGKFVLDALKTQSFGGTDRINETWVDDDGVSHTRTITALDWPGHAKTLGAMMARIYETTKNLPLVEQ